jgi:HEAT repeat protein
MKIKSYHWLLVAVVVLAVGCATAMKGDWQEAESANTVEAYEEFLKNHPEGELADKARSRLERMYFEKAQAKDTITDYEKFLKQYPKGDYADKAKEKIMELRFKETAKKDNISAYQKFLKSYPKGPFSEKALSRIKELTKKEQIKALHSAKTVRIVVSQSYEKAEDISLPFEDLAGKLFKYAGLKVVGADVKDYDVALKVQAKGKPLGTVQTEKKIKYSGASLSGTISLEIPRLPDYKKSFKGSMSPSDKRRPSQLRASDTPFNGAFRAKDSFIPKMFEIMGEFYGNKPLIEAIKDGVLVIKWEAGVSLKRIKDSVEIEQLIVAMKDKDYAWNVADALVKIGKPAVNQLITFLRDENWEVRKNVAEILGRIKDNRAVKPLIASLNDRDENFRAIAAEALGEIKDPNVVKPLITVFTDEDEDMNVRWKAAVALGRIKDTRAVEPLISALKDRNREIRWIAATALGEIKDARAVDALITALEDKHNKVRERAAFSLGELKDSRAVESLISNLRDKDKIVRLNSAEALVKITKKDFGEDQNKWKEWWEKSKKK